MPATTLPMPYAGRRHFDPAALNRLHRSFWLQETAKLERRMSEPVMVEEILDLLDRQHQAPARREETIYVIAERAEERQARVGNAAAAMARSDERRRYAQQGGRSKQPDALQALIEDIVGRRPAISPDALLDALRDHANGDVIQDIDEGEEEAKVVFATGRTAAKPAGSLKDAPIRALRHRLSRAKKTVRERGARASQ